MKNRSDGPEKSGAHQARSTLSRRDEKAAKTVGRAANEGVSSSTEVVRIATRVKSASFRHKIVQETNLVHSMILEQRVSKIHEKAKE